MRPGSTRILALRVLTMTHGEKREAPVLELYGAASCPFTAEMRAHLEYERRPFVEYDLETDDAARIRLVTMTGQRMVPTLVEEGRVVAVGWHGRASMV